jgi:hypothetical protein
VRQRRGAVHPYGGWQVRGRVPTAGAPSWAPGSGRRASWSLEGCGAALPRTSGLRFPLPRVHSPAPRPLWFGCWEQQLKYSRLRWAICFRNWGWGSETCECVIFLVW